MQKKECTNCLQCREGCQITFHKIQRRVIKYPHGYRIIFHRLLQAPIFIFFFNKKKFSDHI